MRYVFEYHLPNILIFIFAMFATYGIGYLIVNAMAQQERQYNACISSGKQYIKGNCVN